MNIETIKSAYGTYWEHVKDHADIDGWCRNFYTGNIDMYYELNVGPIQFEKSPVRRWRPAILNNTPQSEGEQNG